MKYPCGIIKDLLPLYVDKVCNSESETAVEKHISECENCKQYYNELMSDDNIKPSQDKTSAEELKMAESLKEVKRKLNKKHKVMAAFSLISVLCFVGAYYTLFNIPLKSVDLEDVSVDVKVYETDKLPKHSEIDNADVHLSSDPKDDSNSFVIEFPDFPNQKLSMTENTIKKCNYVTVISWSSPYFLREIRNSDINNADDDVLYISDFKTTILGNKAQEYNSKIMNLEMKKYSKIVYVGKNGDEKVLWQEDSNK